MFCRQGSGEAAVDPNEIGPAPEAGRLLSFDTKKRTVVFFDLASGTLKTVSYLPVNEQDDVSRTDPRVAKTKFPAVDRQNKTVTIYSRRKKILLATFSVPDEYLALPDDTWKSGDEIPLLLQAAWPSPSFDECEQDRPEQSRQVSSRRRDRFVVQVAPNPMSWWSKEARGASQGGRGPNPAPLPELSRPAFPE